MKECKDLNDIRILTDDELEYAIKPYRSGNTPDFNRLFKIAVQEYWERILDYKLKSRDNLPTP